MTPVYIPNQFAPGMVAELVTAIPWENRTSARLECFMTSGSQPYIYTYGSGRGIRQYTSIPMTNQVASVMDIVNDVLASTHPSWGPMTGCFLNRYDDDHHHLGWHSDDFTGMDHTRAVVSVSFGNAREIWWRRIGATGEVPHEDRQLLEDGSIFVMPPGMQHTHQHRIPKGSCPMGLRVSMTFRPFLPAGSDV